MAGPQGSHSDQAMTRRYIPYVAAFVLLGAGIAGAVLGP